MSVLENLSGLAGGIAEGYQAGVNSRIDRQDAGIRKAAEDRTARDDAMNQLFQQIFAERAKLEQPAQAPAPVPMGALPAPETAPLAPESTPAAAGPQGASPALPNPATAGAASPAPQGGMGPPQPQLGGGTPAPQALAQSRSSYRDRYNDWRTRSMEAAMLAGGLKGAELFTQTEDALSRRRMLDLGAQAAQALDGNDTAQAAKLLNTAMEVSPNDTGLEWVPHNGQLYLKGGDGQLSEKPYNADAVRAVLEERLMTPENYLAFQASLLGKRQQDEVERAAPVQEELLGRQAAVDERRMALDEKLEPRKTAAAEMNALSNAIQSKGLAEYYRSAGSKAGDANGWSTAQQQKLLTDLDDWELKEVHKKVEGLQEYYDANPQAYDLFKSDVAETLLNHPPGTVMREDAAFVSHFIRLPQGVDVDPKYLDENGDVRSDLYDLALNRKTGQVRVTYNGKTWILPEGQAQIVRQSGKLSEPATGAPPSNALPSPAPEGPQRQGILPQGSNF